MVEYRKLESPNPPTEMAPSKEEIAQMFAPLSEQGQQSRFFDSVIDNVDWTILGHSPMSGKYGNKEDFIAETLTVLREKVLTEPLRLKVIHISGGGQSDDYATVEMQSIDAMCKNGMTYDMTYCWVCRFEGGKIVQVRAYLCTKLLTDAIEQNQ